MQVINESSKIDVNILRQLEGGSRAVFEQLFNKYYPVLTRFAEGYVFNRAICEDIVQDFFVWLWENRKNLNVHSSIQAYFYQSIRNRCLDHLKHLDVEDKYKILFVQSYLNTDIDIEKESNQSLRDKLLFITNQMPTQMAEFIKAKYFDAKKVEEIANEHKVSVNTVKTQLARGRNKIKKLFLIIIVGI